VAGATAHKKISGLKSQLFLDPNHCAIANIQASIQTATINTGNSIRDKTLKGKEYFDVEQFPTISFPLPASRARLKINSKVFLS